MLPSDLKGPLYIDASALVKAYLSEPESEAVNRILEGRQDLVVSDLAVTETASALARRRREGKLLDEAASRAYRLMREHQATGVFRTADLTARVHREADRMLLSLDIPLRAGDALHLALAKSEDAVTVVTFDGRLAVAARRIGLAVAP